MISPNGQQTAALGIFCADVAGLRKEREAAPSNPNMARGLLAAALVACAAVAQEVQMEARASVRRPTLSITKLEMRAPPAARGPRQPAQGLCPAASGCPTHRRPARRPHTQ